MDKHFVDTCTIAVGPATGTVFPISSLGLKINALYDTGATKSCMSLKMFESLKLRLTKDRCPFVVTATGTSMEPIGSTECSFDINGRVFTQKFIVCNNQTRPIILGKDFAAKNCIGVVWTKQGLRKMIDDDCKVIMEVEEQTTDIPLSLTNSIRIPPHTIAVAEVECATPLNSTMDIRADEGFLRDFPNIHVARSYINNPQQSLAPNCIPFAFTNLSMYSQYLGKDKVVGFAQPIAEDIEVHALADHEEIAEMMWGPWNHIPCKTQAKYKMPIIPLDNAFITSPADVPGPRKVDLQDADITPGTRSAFDALCEKYPKVFSKGNEDIGRTQLVTMDIDTGDSPPISSRPYTLALNHYRWVQEEIETLERAGVITKSMSPWASPIVMVPKKSQVPFGLAQAPAFFQHLMNKVLDNCSFAMTYLDDIINFSNSEEEHLAHIDQIFRRLEAADLKMKRSKYDFFKKHIHYLGHLISADGVRPLKDKLDTIRDMPAPRSSKEVKQFLSLAGYYRKFVPHFADLSRPLA